MKIFLVEDDEWYGKMLEYQLSLNPDHEVHWFKQGLEALAALSEKPEVVVLDYDLPDTNGGEVLKSVKAKLPQTAVVMVSAQEDIGTAVQLLHAGAYDYLVKNNDTIQKLWAVFRNLQDRVELQKEVKALRQQVAISKNSGMIGESAAIEKLKQQIAKAAQTDINVSITGETGTGKEVVANELHRLSKRSKKPFVAVNVAAIPENLIESELFGYTKGAFTGAVSDKKGKFEEADKGTLFLDEIGEMPLDLQAKLLRVLQEREVTRIGSNKTIKLDIRLIVATHQNLSAMVEQGTFRQDLYFRLVGFPIALPPLRERGSDIVLMARHFIQAFCQKNGLGNKQLSNEVVDMLLSHSYPGNVRELKSMMELAAVMAEGNTIRPKDIRIDKAMKAKRVAGQEMSLQGHIAEIVQQYLDRYDGNVLLVAKKLEMGKSTIYNMLKRKEVTLPEKV